MRSLQPTQTIRRTAARRALTFLDMVIVVMILGLLSAVTMPKFAAVQRQNRLRNAALTLVEHLRLARETAIARATPVVVTFTPAQAIYAAPQVESPERPGETLQVNLRQSLHSGIALTAQFNHTSTLEFGIDGLPRAAGQPVTSSSLVITDGSASESIALIHGWGTARWVSPGGGASGAAP